MTTTLPILVAYDGSADSERALRWAAAESLRTRFPLRVLAVNAVIPPTWGAVGGVGMIGVYDVPLSDSTAVLAPGRQLSLQVTVDKLRFGEPAATQAALEQALTARLKADEMTVADDQPVVLRATYGEAEGETLVETQRRVGQLPGQGQPTGRSVQTTKSLLQLTLTNANGSETFWSHTVEMDPKFASLRKEATDAAARQEMFESLERDQIRRGVLNT